jgi:Secretion system C-terminal sorting domain/Polysaccharide deacetylase
LFLKLFPMRLLFTIITIIFCTILSFSQKVVIHFDNNPTTPSVSKATFKYNKDFAYSFTLDDATVDAFTCAYSIFNGGKVAAINANYDGLFQTDGCGNSIPFRAGVAWNTANIYGEDVHNGNLKNALTWGQLDTLIDSGWDVFNHSFSHKSRWFGTMNHTDYVNEIQQNITAVKQKTKRKFDLNAFVVPSGDDIYQDIALEMGQKIVFDQRGDVTGIGGLTVTDNMRLDNLKIHRQLLEENFNSSNRFDSLINLSQNGKHIWYNEFTHRIDNFQGTGGVNFYTFFSYMKNIAEAHGKNGTDRVWFAPLQEVYEYLLTKQNITYTTTSNGKDLDLNFNQKNVPKWLRRNVLTLLVNSETNFSSVDVPAGVKVSFKGIGKNKIINLDFTDYVPSTPTSVSESTPSVFFAFPNPTGDTLTVDLENETGEYDYTIIDFFGKKHITGKIRNKRTNLNVQSLQNGSYILSLTKGNKVFSHKFVKN